MDEVLSDLRRELDRTIDAFRGELAHVRTGRASAALLEGISVDYYGTRTPLNQLATVTVPEVRLLVVQPYDPSAIAEIERAILRSDLGLVPINDGKIIRVPIPELTEERRRELVKHLRKVAEKFRVSLRSHRRDSMDLLKAMEKEKEISEDELRRAEEKVQHVVKEFGSHLEKVLQAKEAEVMEV